MTKFVEEKITIEKVYDKDGILLLIVSDDEGIYLVNTDDLSHLTELIRDLTNNTYDKYWDNNLYVLSWKWHKQDCKVVDEFYAQLANQSIPPNT